MSDITKLRILLVEDDINDRLLIERELRKEFEDLELLNAQDIQEFEEVLKKAEFDLVITDYLLGWTNGAEVLEAVKKALPNMPVIMFTGSISEKIAIEALQSGLDDYLIKTPKNYKRLAKHVHGLLDKQKEVSKREVAEEALVQERNLLESIFRAAPTGVGLVKDRVLLNVNDKICDMLGYTKKELVGKNARILYLTKKDFDYVGKEKYRQIAKDGTGTVETRWKKKDGEIIDVLLSSTPIDVNDLSKGVTFTALDITERNQTKNTLEFQAKLLDTVGQAIVATDTDLKITYFNQAAETLFGYKSSYAIGKTIHEIGKPQFSKQRFKELFRVMKKGLSWSATDTVFDRRGSQFDVNIVFTPVMGENNRPKGYIAALTDITEDRSAEEQLKASEERYRSLIEDSIQGVVIMKNGKVVFANPSLAKMVGYTVKQLQNLDADKFLGMVHPDDREAVIERFSAPPRDVDERSNKAVYRIIDKKGKIIWLEGISKTITYKGEPAVLTFTHDITKERNARLKIEHEQKKAQEYLKIAGVMFVALDNKGNVTMINDRGSQILGYKEKEILGKNWFKEFIPKSYKKTLKGVTKDIRTSRGKEREYFENPVLTKSGEERLIAWHNATLRDDDGNVIGTLSSGEDITERKKAEEELIKEKELITTIAETSPVGITVVDANGRITYLNKAAEQVLGLSRSKIKNRMYNDPVWMITDYNGKPFPDSKLPFTIVNRTKKPIFNVEHAIQWPDGHRKLLSINAAPLFKDDGQFSGMVSIIEDVTEKMKAEVELKNIFGLSLDLFCIADLHKATFLKINPAWMDVLGYTEEELLGSPFLDFIHPEDVQPTLDVIDKELKKGKTVIDFTNRYRCKDGSYKWFEWTSHPIESEGVTYAVARDITEKKKAREALKDSEERLKIAGRAAYDLIYEWDVKTDSLTWFGDVDGMLGYPEGVIKDDIRSWLKLIHKDDRPKLDDAVKLHRTSTKPIRYQYKIKEKSGAYQYWDDHALPLLDETGKPYKWIGVCSNITSVKEAEIALKESEAHLRFLTENVADILWTVNMDFKTTYVSPTIERLLGFTPEERNQMDFVDTVTPETFERLSEQFLREFNDHKANKKGPDRSISLEVEYYHKDGHTVWFENNMKWMWVDGEIVGIMGVSRDITERKKAEDLLTRSEYEKSQILESMLNAFVLFESVFDKKGKFISYRFLYINKAYEEITGVKNDEVFGKTVHEVWPETEPEWIKRYGEVAVSGVPQEFELYHDPTKKDYHCQVFKPFESTDKFCVIFEDITERNMAEKELKKNQFLLTKAQELGKIGTWELDLVNNVLTWTEQNYRIFGMKPGTHLTYEKFLKSVHPDDRKYVDKKWKEGMKRNNYDIEHRLVVDGKVRWVREKADVTYGKNKKPLYAIGFTQDITERKEAEKKLKDIEWMLSTGVKKLADTEKYVPFYGDVTELNTERTILDSVDRTELEQIATQTINLLDTSVAVYEKNGDYAYGMFASGWCRFMDASSRRLCGRVGNKKALASGKWLCHDNCWNHSAKAAILSGEPTDIECVGGIHLYAVPIIAGKDVVGAINIGYGDPPRDEVKLNELAKKFKVETQELKQLSQQYRSRPQFIIELAKEQLKNFALRIGDIIEQKRMGIELKNTLDATTDGIWMWDFKTDELTFSPKYYTMLGYEPNEFPATFKGWSKLLHPDDKKQAIKTANDYLKSKPDIYENEFRLRTRSGDYRWIRAKARVTKRGPKGEAHYLIGNHEDITEKKKSELALKESKRRLMEAQYIAKIGDVTWNVDTGEVEWSDGMYDLMGYDKNETLNLKKVNSSLHHPDDLPIIQKWLDEIVNSKKKTFTPNEYRIIRGDGKVRWVHTEGVIKREKGTTTVFATVQDITEKKTAEDALLGSEADLKRAQYLGRMGSWSWDVKNNLLEWSDELYNIFGVKRDEFKLTFKNIEKMIFPEDRKKNEEKVKELMGSTDGSAWELRMKRPDGKTMYIYQIVEVERDGLGKPERLLGIIQDITLRKAALSALEESEERYRTLFSGDSDTIILYDDKTMNIIDVNPAATQMYGYSPEEFKKLKATDLSAEPEKTKKAMQEDKDEHIPVRYHKRKDGSLFPVEINANRVDLQGQKVNISTIRDITSRIEAAENLLSSMREKEVLLKEVHHRVKNNMQMINSLMELQSDTVVDKNTIRMFQDAQDRVRSMAFVHEALYKSQDLANISAKDYITRLVTNLYTIYKGRGIDLDVDIEDVGLNIDTSIPCGLIVSELVSNSMKYAFEGKDDGMLTVSLTETKSGKYKLIVSDNGNGIPKEIDVENPPTLGLQLVQMLTKQIKGNIRLARSKGTKFTIEFEDIHKEGKK